MPVRSEKGFSLIETMVGVALLCVIGIAIMGGLIFSSKVLGDTDERQTAKTLAESQMEFVKNQPYAPVYAPANIPAEYADYAVEINVGSLRDGNLQKIAIIVSHRGNPIILAANATLEGYKVNK
jgi:type II secretory pathway pseudopilin PulG